MAWGFPEASATWAIFSAESPTVANDLIGDLVSALSQLPGIGRKTAQRLTFFIMGMPEGEALAISRAIERLKSEARLCSQCFHVTDAELCSVCRSAGRDTAKICVVEEPADLIMIERTHEYRGLYHVLHGVLSPMDGLAPERLKIRELLERVRQGRIEEVIIATNPTTKGEATAQYLAERLRPLGVTVSRIAYGLPLGGDIEFADEVTLGRALSGRSEI